MEGPVQMHSAGGYTSITSTGSLLFIGLDKEMQVELIHVVQDVVAVRSNQVLVVVDLLLW